MDNALFDASADRKTLTVSVNGDLLDRVHAAGIDLAHVIEAAMERALANTNPEMVRDGIAAEMRWLDEYVAKHGDPRAEWLAMSDEDDAT
jgi:post-segregation antitoxin (ccd killing protein)